MEFGSVDFYNKQTPEEKEMQQNAREIYDEIGSWFEHGLLGVRKEKLWGFINSKGEVVFDFIFTTRPVFEESGYARAYIGRHKCGMINAKGDVIIDFKYDNVSPYAEDGFARVEKGSYWGTFDKEGNEHIKTKMKFQQIRTFHDGIAPAKIGTKWGLIDTEGNHISEFKYYDIEEEKGGIFYTRINAKTDGFLNRKGELIEKPLDENDLDDDNILNKYNLAYQFIPLMLQIIKENEGCSLKDMADLYFFKHCAEQTRKVLLGFEWYELEIDVAQFDDGRAAIIYKFPKPDREPEAVWGAIVLTDEGYYYITLEYCTHPGRYLLAFTSREEHVPLGMYDIDATKENFEDMLEHTLPFVMRCNPKSVFCIPEEYQEVQNMPEDPDNCLTIAKKTTRAICFVQLFPIDSPMPLYDNRRIINNLYETLEDNQAIIEVNCGKTTKGYHYAYHITKTRKELYGVIYKLVLHIFYGNVTLCIRTFFEEIGMTGERDAFVLELMRREGSVTLGENGIEGWCYDPYDENSTRSYLMNISEQVRFDEVFPEHPLTQCRDLLKYIIENQ